MLLYCTGGYAEHYMSIPGIGIILTKTSDSIYYRYLPLVNPIVKDDIDKYFINEDKKKFTNIRFNSYWLFEISRESFFAATENLSIKWP